jgi:hypothetical protein
MRSYRIFRHRVREGALRHPASRIRPDTVRVFSSLGVTFKHFCCSNLYVGHFRAHSKGREPWHQIAKALGDASRYDKGRENDLADREMDGWRRDRESPWRIGRSP